MHQASRCSHHSRVAGLFSIDLPMPAGQPSRLAVTGQPCDGLPLGKADKRGTDGRQDRDLSFADIRLARKDQGDAPHLFVVGSKNHGRSHLHDI